MGELLDSGRQLGRIDRLRDMYLIARCKRAPAILAAYETAEGCGRRAPPVL